MKSILLLAMALVLACSGVAWTETATLDSGPFEPMYYLTVGNDSGQEAIIDFSGDTVTYSGDLPVAESAKLFFESVKNLCPKCPEAEPANKPDPDAFRDNLKQELNPFGLVASHPGFDGLCPQCKKEGLKSTVTVGGCMSTLMATHAWYDENGKYHFDNPNTTTCTAWCSNGHSFGIEM